jgi:adenosylcobyric acid synthase
MKGERSVPAKVLMVQGTASSTGKSVLVTALCRILRQDGFTVAPFKAQNMSNNSYVTLDGGEIGRAQVNQAEAAGVEPETDMNPILLKPESDHRVQIVLNGKPYKSVGASEYQDLKLVLWPHVSRALDRLRERFDVLVIEGAGSPAEINLQHADIVNMTVARYANAPVVLVGDIDRGGVFAHLVGTLSLIELRDRQMVRALVINKFRGDYGLLEPGLKMLRARTGLPVAGVVPYLNDIDIAEEDAVALDGWKRAKAGTIDICVVRLPHISNFDDLDPLEREPSVTLRYITTGTQLGQPDLIIVPGTKSTISDLAWMRMRGLADAVVLAARSGVALIGVCGGYQMLGQRIIDMEGVESSDSSVRGLGLLSASTEFEPAKTTTRVQARVLHNRGLLSGAEGSRIRGYEIHMGRTYTSESVPFSVDGRTGDLSSSFDGAVTTDGWTIGTYMHGIFANDDLRSILLRNLARRKGVSVVSQRSRVEKDQAYERLAGQFRSALDMQLIRDLLDSSLKQEGTRSTYPQWAM